MTAQTRVAVVVTLLAGLAVAGVTISASAPAADGAPTCSTTGPGGDWPSYGHDANNSRTQPQEHEIGVKNAGRLRQAWRFVPMENGKPAVLDSTPTEDGGCVFVGTSAGFVYALSVEDGHVVWKTQLPVTKGGLGGDIVGAIDISAGRAYALINEEADGTDPASGPYAVALDEHTGALLWRSAPLSTHAGDYTNASPVIYDGVLAAGWSPPESDPTGQGGLALVDTETGALLTRVFTIPPDRQALGRAGGGIWTNPAIDSAGYAYAGTGNPYNKDAQDPNTDAIIKVDLNRTRATFGQIVGAYQGNVDTYTALLTVLGKTPICAATANLFTSDFFDDPVCGQLDLDFGAAPNLFSVNGKQVVGELQKAGVYHVAYTASMTRAWASVVGTPCTFCNGSSTSAVNGKVYGEGVLGGQAFGLHQANGKYAWLSPVLDGIHYEPVSEANNVVYTLDSLDFLDAFNAANGLPVGKRLVLFDSGDFVVNLSSTGVSVARDHVFVAVGSLLEPGVPSPTTGYLIAYTAP